MNCKYRVLSIYNMDPLLILYAMLLEFSANIFAKKLLSKLTENSFKKSQNKLLLETDVKSNEPVWIYFDVYQ